MGIRETLLESGAVKFGDFVLTSGKKSDYYIDIKEASTRPEILNAMADAISLKISAKKIAGMELGAVPILVATALKTKIDYVIIRKTERTHGTNKRWIGEINNGEKIDVIDDVATTGGSILKSVEILRSHGAVVENAICVVDREEGAKEFLKENGINLIPVITVSQLR
ncbi:orotate phosphoribosyltransferase [Acidiplasma sp.]|uniref:orotate phosphoribosyltransferase n=1 Tax=Acidiplasma sp. TaxID=1872114 RepID=UPI00258ADC40|nr:orotate phosphoribosyltransferase [Acidiplasma sp.]